CDDPYQLGSLLRAAEACYDGALAYRTPFISGKDSLSNQFTTEDGKVITIPPTLLITALGIVPDVARCCTMDAKAAGHALLIVGQTTSALGGSHYRMIDAGRDDWSRDGRIPRVNLARGPATARAVAGLIQRGLVASAHDCSDGGLLVAAAEMAFAGRVGLDLDLAALPTDRELDLITACFAETPSRYLLEVEPAALDAVTRALRSANIPFGQIGTFADHDRLTLRTLRDGQVLSARLDELRQAWLEPLDW
ncbi:MAG TPA: AIR synthase-related protein, partial [Phycisphaeraceae bacterium]